MLTPNWLTDGLIDFEYKKYILLAYLQRSDLAFKEQRLYPALSDLIFHYDNLLKIKDGKELLHQHFPQEISQADFQKLRLNYRRLVEDDEMMAELEEIIHFAIPQFERHLEDGKDLYENLAEKIELEPVGVVPLLSDEGYLFFQQPLTTTLKIYRYQSSLFENPEGSYRGIHLSYLEETQRSLGETYERVKLRLIRENQELPNPATYLFVTQAPCPFEEAFLPISKRMFMRHLAKLAS